MEQPDPEVARVKPNLQALTGLRLVAALAVYISHVRAPRGAPTVVARFFDSGYMGVTVFFVLSGFVLSYRYFDTLARPTISGLWSFFTARFARIYPLYLLVLGFVFLRLRSAHLSTHGVLGHVLGLQAWDADVFKAFGFNPPAWSISVELFLYACCPLLILVLARRNRRSLVAIALAIFVGLFVLAWLFSRHDLPTTAANSSHRWLYHSPLTRLGDFTLGIIAARLYATARESKIGGYLAALGMLAIVGMMCWRQLYYTAWSWDAAYVVPSVMVIAGLACAPRSLLARALSRPLMVRLGEASFAFYLIHFEMIQILGAGAWRDRFTLTSFALEVTYLAIILCLALGVHLLFELPARNRVRSLSASVARRLDS